MPSNPIKRGNSAFRRARREARVGRTRPGAAAPTCPPILGHPNAPARTPAFDPADFDRLLRSAVMRRTLGRSPVSLMTAMTDWLGHLALAPSVCWRLAEHAAGRSADFWRDAMIRACGGTPPESSSIAPLPQDTRFSDPAWQQWPFNVIHQGFLAQELWWEEATIGAPGMSRHNRQLVSFLARQWLDQFAPSNFFATNPVVLRETLRTGGRNLWDGARNFADDALRSLTQQRPAGSERFKVGEAIAATPGKVIYRNELIELIQYTPATGTVHPEPILIVPAWIMKYYVLDLSPENSLIRHLVGQGFTVFAISWRNPGPEHSQLGMDDYLTLGIDAALQAVRTVVPDHPVHAVGYCLGGTLLAIAAAALGRRRDTSVGTVTLLAAQTDFADAGELTLFVDDSEITFLEDMMWSQGELYARQMAGAFHLLRSNDLIWSRLVRDYLLGGRTPVTDLVAWSEDATNMPYRMHSEYLRRLFLDNDLSGGRYLVDGTPVALSNIRYPMFVVATEWDHIAPWKSVYKVHLQLDTDVTFALSSGGHNTAIVNPPDGSTKQFRIGTHGHDDSYVSPDNWLADHAPQPGSWWTAWIEWLRRHSSVRSAPPTMGAVGYRPMADAPGTYVFNR